MAARTQPTSTAHRVPRANASISRGGRGAPPRRSTSENDENKKNVDEKTYRGRFPRRLRGGGGGAQPAQTKSRANEPALRSSPILAKTTNCGHDTSPGAGASATANRARTGASACYIYSHVSPIFARRRRNRGRTREVRKRLSSKARGPPFGASRNRRRPRNGRDATEPNGARHRGRRSRPRGGHRETNATVFVEDDVRVRGQPHLCTTVADTGRARTDERTPEILRTSLFLITFVGSSRASPAPTSLPATRSLSKGSNGLLSSKFATKREKASRTGSGKVRFDRPPLSNSGLVRGRAEAAPVARARTTRLLDGERPPPRPPAHRSNMSNVRGTRAPLAAASPPREPSRSTKASAGRTLANVPPAP